MWYISHYIHYNEPFRIRQQAFSYLGFLLNYQTVNCTKHQSGKSDGMGAAHELRARTEEIIYAKLIYR